MPNVLDRIWSAVASTRRGKKRGRSNPANQLSGSRESIGLSQRKQYPGLDVPDIAVRPVNGSIETAQYLLQMGEWSYEVKNGISFLVRDAFCETGGRTGSWSVGPEVYGDGQIGPEPHPRVKAIAQDLAKRYYGKKLIIGGDRLKKAARDALLTGNACLEFAFE